MLDAFKMLALTASQLSCGGAGTGDSSASGGASSPWFMIVMLVMIVVLFFVMSIPQRKRDKKMKEMLASVKQGDRVRTIGGIYGTVTNIKDDVVTISVGPDKVRLVFARGAIATIEDAPVETTIDGEVKDVK